MTWAKTSQLFCFFAGILVLPAGGPQLIHNPSACAWTEQDSVTDTVLLRKGTPVYVGNVEEVSSKTAKPGQRIGFKVLDDVQAEGRIVIAKGSDAWGTVTEIAAARRMGRTASMTVSVEVAFSVTSEDIPLRKSTQLKDPNELGNAIGKTIKSFPYFMPLTPLFLLMHGDESVMLKGTRVMGTVDKDMSFDSTTIARLQPLRPPQPAPSGYVVVYLFRQKDRNPSSPIVYCGKANIGRSEQGKYFKIQLPPGTYHLRAFRDVGFEIELQDGKEYYIRGLSEGETPGLVINPPPPVVHLVPALPGEFEMLAADLKPVDPKEVKDVSKIDLKKLQDLRD